VPDRQATLGLWFEHRIVETHHEDQERPASTELLQKRSPIKILTKKNLGYFFNYVINVKGRSRRQGTRYGVYGEGKADLGARSGCDQLHDPAVSSNTGEEKGLCHSLESV
jgi:hypothetical protein